MLAAVSGLVHAFLFKSKILIGWHISVIAVCSDQDYIGTVAGV